MDPASYNKVGECMKPIIGIITRKDKTESGNTIDLIYSDIISAIIKSGGVPIGIPISYSDRYIDLCDGFILEGGDDVTNDNLSLLRILKEKDIPVLGMCLGMQEIAYLCGGEIIDINNHKIKGMHEVTIDKESLLHKIFGCTKTMVNSRHTSAVAKTSLFISAKSIDNIPEAIEDKNQTFHMGIQWHPENMYEYDLNSRKIFDYFVKVCANKKN